VTRRTGFSLTAVALIGITAIVIGLPSGADPTPTPLRGPLDLVPSALQGWRPGPSPPPDMFRDDAVATYRLRRTYNNGALPIWVSVGYYPLQVAMKRPRARDLLFPGHGWTTLSERSVTLPVRVGAGDGLLSANLVTMTTGGQPLAIVYWYQVGPRAVTGDHWYRALVIYNRLVHGRADGALIRIASPVPSGMPVEAVLERHADFLRVFLPELMPKLPD
jgi:EpsI family protein